jgi:ATP-binding protein involved in chromosome partitioning
VLGLQPRFPEEKEGILPLRAAEGLWFMSAAAFTGEHALPLRGPDVTNAILELAAVTRWGDLDYLLIDMPPGIGDGILDLIALVPRLETLVVSTPSPVSVSVVERLVRLLGESRVPVSGVIANLCRDGAETVREMARRCGVLFAGEVPFDPAVEKAVGRPSGLAGGAVAAALGAALAQAGIR